MAGMNQEDGGSPHLMIGDLVPEDARVRQVYVLVATQPDGGEGIYAHRIGDHMFNFAVSELPLKEILERFIREKGSIEVCRREGIKLEWRTYFQVGAGEEIT